MFCLRPIACKTKNKLGPDLPLNPTFISKTITMWKMRIKMLMFLSSLFILIGIQKTLIMTQTSRLRYSKNQSNFQTKSAMFAWIPLQIRSKVLLEEVAWFMAGDWLKNWKLFQNCGTLICQWSIKRSAIHLIQNSQKSCRTLHFVLEQEMEKLAHAMVWTITIS